MKREGRMHGSNVRLGKRQWEYGYREKISNKPTNQSKCTDKRPLTETVSHIVLTEHELPTQKSIGKTKSAFKAKDLDITRNHLMQDWSLYEQGHLAADEDYNASAAYRKHWDSEDNIAGGHADEDAQQEEEFWEEEASRDWNRSKMVLPIESLLTMRKRKIASKASVGQQQMLALPVKDESGENILERNCDNKDEMESWWGVGFYDGEDVPDDWFLITEGEGFVA